jgi:O-glycosyl hydrolase
MPSFTIKSYISVFIVTLFLSCEKENTTKSSNSTPPKVVPKEISITITKDTVFQKIAGFGGANRMWGTQFLKPKAAKLAFGSSEEDLGLSIFRVRVPSDTNEWPLILESVKEAQKYGAKILACPWSPPAHLKNTKSTIGGHLLPENYGAFKDYINSYINYMNKNGVDIYSVSIQNEPDIKVTYESCDWSSDEMMNFLTKFGNQIKNSIVSAPESFNFNRNFTNSLLQNPESAKNFGIVAGHIYGNGLGTIPLAEEMKKEIWMTEYLLNLNTGNANAAPWNLYSETAIFEETLEMLRTIHVSMKSNWNAYIWWYLQRYYSFIGDGEQGTPLDAVLKRGWAFSHFSKFVRPGYNRVGVRSSQANDLQITAYDGDNSNVVVIINPTDKPIILTSEFLKVSSAIAVETNVTSNRKALTTEVSNNKVKTTISPKTIVTLVAKS